MHNHDRRAQIIIMHFGSMKFHFVCCVQGYERGVGSFMEVRTEAKGRAEKRERDREKNRTWEHINCRIIVRFCYIASARGIRTRTERFDNFMGRIFLFPRLL